MDRRTTLESGGQYLREMSYARWSGLAVTTHQARRYFDKKTLHPACALILRFPTPHERNARKHIKRLRLSKARQGEAVEKLGIGTSDPGCFHPQTLPPCVLA